MSGLIILKSEDGQKLLADVQMGKGLFQRHLYGLFSKQIGNQNCGIQSVAMILSAQEIGTKVHGTDNDTKYTEMALLDMPETKTVITPQKILECHGMGVKDVSDLLAVHGKGTVYHHAPDVTANQFREQAKDALKNENSSSGIIVNYHMATLGQSPTFGHHSPLAAYHEETDRFLLLDVWRDTEECWALSEDLYKAMNTVDNDTGNARGYILLK